MNTDGLQLFIFPEPKSAHARQDQCRSVYWIGQGPGVVLMHELPGLTDFVVTFGREIPASGYTVFMPVMFGKPFPGGLERLANETGICINREFSLFSQCKVESNHRLAADALW
jgi:dienelactone hydrolase